MNVMHVPDDSETGYILEVDLEYSDDLHDNHSDYPLAPKNKIITKKNAISSYSYAQRKVGIERKLL